MTWCDRTARFGQALFACAVLTGCGTIDIPIGEDGGLSLGTSGSFVIRGQLQQRDAAQNACLAFITDTGVIYQLFQDPDLDNEVFDAVTTPGRISRLVVNHRSDIEVGCPIGIVVEVIEVLEIVPPPNS